MVYGEISRFDLHGSKTVIQLAQLNWHTLFKHSCQRYLMQPAESRKPFICISRMFSSIQNKQDSVLHAPANKETKTQNPNYISDHYTSFWTSEIKKIWKYFRTGVENFSISILTSKYCLTILLFTSSVSLEWAISLRRKSSVCFGWKWIAVFLFIALSYTFADSEGEYFCILLYREN